MNYLGRPKCLTSCLSMLANVLPTWPYLLFLFICYVLSLSITIFFLQKWTNLIIILWSNNFTEDTVDSNGIRTGIVRSNASMLTTLPQLPWQLILAYYFSVFVCPSVFPFLQTGFYYVCCRAKTGFEWNVAAWCFFEVISY